jgi:hypothetical protein
LRRDAGYAVLGLGVIVGGVGAALYYTCTASFGNFCVGYGNRQIGLVGIVFGGILFVIGIVILVMTEKPGALVHPWLQFPGPTVPWTARPEEFLFCPVCGTRYQSSTGRFCLRDGTELRALR